MLSSLKGAFNSARALISMRLYLSKGLKGDIVGQFHTLYYSLGRETWKKTYWLGHPVSKLPMDLWLYQELFHRLRPDLVIETGTLHGGSAQYFASICDLLDNGEIVSVDIAPLAQPPHPRITYLTGSSTADHIVEEVTRRAAGKKTVLVVLDSDHTRDHVLEELRLYSPLVTPGSYLVVEDTNVNGHPVEPDWGPGPMEALDAFLAQSADFEIDDEAEKFLVSFNPRGYLKRVG